MKLAMKISLGTVAVFMSLIIIAVNMPVRLFAGSALESLKYTDLEGASLLAGDLWITQGNLTGLAHLEYQWCPGLSVLRWCIDLEHPAVSLSAKVKMNADQSLLATGLRIDSLDMAALGISGGLVGSRITGDVSRLGIELGGCPLNNVVEVSGTLSTSDIQIFGAPTGAHEIAMSTSQEKITLNLVGDTFSGLIELSRGDYSARGEMNAPDAMVPLVRNLMRPLGGNRFGWEINGALPC